MHWSWDLVLRSVNSTACLLSLLFLMRAAMKQWAVWNDKTQGHWWALTGWIALGLEGNIESVILGNEPGPRIILQTLVVAWTLRAITIEQEIHAEPVFKDLGDDE